PFAIRTPNWSLNKRNHRKILVVDGKVGFTGGINMSGVYASSPSRSSGSSGGQSDEEKPWRDTHVRIAGPAVAEFEKIVLRGWREQNGPPLEQREFYPTVPAQGDAVVRIIAN